MATNPVLWTGITLFPGSTRWLRKDDGVEESVPLCGFGTGWTNGSLPGRFALEHRSLTVTARGVTFLHFYAVHPVAERPVRGSVNMVPVKARVYVTFKQSVLDPQGQTIRAALNGLGHKGIEEVRQGKFFEITLDANEDLDAIARDVLSNPVIEDYRIETLS